MDCKNLTTKKSRLSVRRRCKGKLVGLGGAVRCQGQVLKVGVRRVSFGMRFFILGQVIKSQNPVDRDSILADPQDSGFLSSGFVIFFQSRDFYPGIRNSLSLGIFEFFFGGLGYPDKKPPLDVRVRFWCQRQVLGLGDGVNCQGQV